MDLGWIKRRVAEFGGQLGTAHWRVGDGEMNERRTFAYFQRHLKKDAERADIDALFESDYATIAPVFEAFLERLRRAGFECRSLDRFGLEPGSEPAFYFRYDVHIHDLPAAYALARLHEENGVPGVFYITWAFSDREVRWTPYFELLRAFDRRHVQFGLHCAPTTTWLINARFDGDFQRALQHVLGDGFVGEMQELARAQRKSDEQTPALRQIFLGGGEALERIHVGFQECFGRWRTVTGHGSFLSRTFFQVLRVHPELKALTPYFNSVDFLIAFGVDKLGYAFEATRNPEINGQVCRMAFDGHPELPNRTSEFLHGGQSFAITFHPNRWLDGAFSSLIARADAV